MAGNETWTTSNTFGPTGPYTIGPTPGPSWTTPTWVDASTGSSNMSPCDLMGHVVEDWAEYLDGQCVGFCRVCNDRIGGQRPPGGLPFMRLKALMERLIASPGDIKLLAELSEIEATLQAEEAALAEAKALFDVAKKMVECPPES